MSDRKKWIRRLALMTVLLAMVCSLAAAALSYPFLTTTTDSVRLRRSASKTATILTNVPAGAQIEVLEKTGSFYKVKYNGTTGYVQSDYVVTDQATIVAVTPEPMETVSSYPYTTVTRESVNLRQSKSVRATLLKKIPQGAEIIVRANSGTWAEVEYKGITGYVKNEYIVLKEVKKVKVTPTPTPVPTLSPEESAAEYLVLEKGIEGAEVKALQEALIELGYLKGSADGKFGAATENAVLLFQQANDYPTTGVMDANAQAFLYSGKPKASNGKATKVSTVSPVAGATLKLNGTGDAVGELQQQLKDLGYYTGEINRTFDTATKKAVIAFQKKNGITADGIVGEATQKALASEEALPASATPTPKPTATPTPAPTYTVPAYTLRRDDSGDDVKTLQSRLKELGYFKGRVDGKFGAQTASALKAFQTDHGLEADGVAGKGTYAVLFAEDTLAKDATPTPVPEVTPAPGDEESGIPTEANYETLRKGTMSADVAMMQQTLIDLGYLTGEPDGNYGTATEKAVRAFQKTNGLSVDGTAGSETLSQLYSIDAKQATAKATPTPAPNGTKVAVTVTAAPDDGTLRQGSTGSEVKSLQETLIQLGYLTGKADGVFGAKTYAALVAFQKANKLTADGIAGVKTLKKLDSSSVVAATTNDSATATATAAPVKVASSGSVTPSASRVQYANWYTTTKAICRKYPYATVYDYETGISWQVHIFSLGAHADYEPLTAADTSKMEKVFGGNTWNPRAVWVVFADGSIYMASTHSMPHSVQHITDNNFAGHSCLHFPRTQAQVEAIGPYATSHQNTIDAGWAKTQAMK
ncbi:MAG: peptidoglycan-binding protein [Clostridia bacterium]|nr:peptidoglycan-binding protein [Clostridia bacterium]